MPPGKTVKHGMPSEVSSEYFKSALAVALKLAEYRVEVETQKKGGHGYSIPLASVTFGNVLIRAKELYLTHGSAMGGGSF